MRTHVCLPSCFLFVRKAQHLCPRSRVDSCREMPKKMPPAAKRTVLTFVVALVVMQMSAAYSGIEHILGTVMEASPSAITVLTGENKIVVVRINSKTQFTKPGARITEQDIKRGDRVVIDAKREGDRLVAHTVRIKSLTK